MADRVYRPAALMRLRIRLEDFVEAEDSEAQTEAEPFDEKIKAIDARLTTLTSTQAQLRARGGNTQALQADIDRQVRRARRARKALEEQKSRTASLTQEQGDGFSIDITTVPISLDVDLNGFRIADQINATFPFRDAPLVSQIIRACQVDILGGTVPQEDFANPGRWRLSFQRSVIMFRGFADTWETEHDEGNAVVSISARSMESILIDGKMNPLSKSFRINGEGEKISTYVNRILEQFPPTSGKSGGDQLRAVWFGANPDEEPVLSRKTLMRSLQTAQSRNKSGGGAAQGSPSGPGGPQAAVGTPGQPRMAQKVPGQEMSVWDLISQACQLANCLPTYDPSLPTTEDGIIPADHILLRPPQTIFEDVSGIRIAGGAQDGFQRTLRDPNTRDPITTDIRFMVWGHNIKAFKTSRKLGRIKAPTVEVRSYNPDAEPGQRCLAVRYPETKRGTRIGGKGEGKVNEVVVRNVAGIRDKELLKQIAVGLYHQMSRQEVSVEIETDDLASFIDPTDDTQIPNDNADLLRMRAGSPCRVTVAREVKDPSRGLVLSPLSEIFEKRTSEISRFLREQFDRFLPNITATERDGLVEQQTDRIATALSAARISDLFYCRSVGHSWTVDDGWTISMELVNFVEARALPRNLSDTDFQDDQQARLNPSVTTPDQDSRTSLAQAQERLAQSRRGF